MKVLNVSYVKYDKCCGLLHKAIKGQVSLF